MSSKGLIMQPDDSQFNLALYDYDLPREMIAQQAAEPRDSARLMVLHRETGKIEHRVFNEIGDYLSAGDLLALNNTKVFPARTFGSRHTGGKVEVFFLRGAEDGTWEAMVRCGGSPRPGEFLSLEGDKLSIRLLKKMPNGHWRVSLPRGTDLHKKLASVGRMPLPPYIKRDKTQPPDAHDRDRYQTVYAKETGAVAAPTAGLHFTESLLRDLEDAGVRTAEVTLHVGAGTFQPIKEDDIRRHKMHEEYYVIGPDAAQRIGEVKASGGRIVAAGTTACRTLEAAARRPEGFGPAEAWTDLYLTPSSTFKMTDVLLTNFHLPRSTLLVLVAAFAGRESILAAYEEAKRQDYRFYSYGDAMIIL